VKKFERENIFFLLQRIRNNPKNLNLCFAGVSVATDKEKKGEEGERGRKEYVIRE
jgi:hypothetical protein